MIALVVKLTYKALFQKRYIANIPASRCVYKRCLQTLKYDFSSAELLAGNNGDLVFANVYQPIASNLKCKRLPQPAFTCSKLTIKALEQGVKYVSKLTLNIFHTLFYLVFLLLTLNM